MWNAVREVLFLSPYADAMWQRCAVLLSPLVILLGARFLLRRNAMRVLIAIFLVAWGFCIYCSFDDGKQVQVPVKQSSNVNTNALHHHQVVDFVSGVNTFFSSRWDDDILCSKSDKDSQRITSQYIWLEYWTLMYSIALGFAVLGRRICNYIWAWIVLWVSMIWGGGKVFWGFSRETMSMLHGLHSRRPLLVRWPIRMFGPVVALERDEQASIAVRQERFDGVEDLSATPIYENTSYNLRLGLLMPTECVPWLSRWRLWASKHFLFAEDDVINVELCKTILYTLNSPWRWLRPRKVLYVNLRSGDIAENLAIWLSNHNELVKNGRVDVKIQLLPEMIARDFVRRFPVVKSQAVDIKKCPIFTARQNDVKYWSEYRLLVVGGGHNGIAILNASICDAQFEGLKFGATVVNLDSSSKDRYMIECGECCEPYNIEFSFNDALSAEFYRWFEDEMMRPRTEKDEFGAYSRIVVCLHDVEMNRLVAHRLANILSSHHINPRQLIFACSENGVGAMESPSCNYQMFGAIRDVVSAENVIDEYNFKLAKIIHHAYKNGRKVVDSADESFIWYYNLAAPKWSVDDVWFGADYYGRRSSIACACGMVNWFRLCGWRGDDLLKDAEDRADAARKIARHMDYFARCEHLRWNAFQLTSGILSISRDEDTHKVGVENLRFTKNGYVAKIYDEDRMIRRHAAIATFEELDALDREINELNRVAYEKGALLSLPPPSSMKINDVRIIEGVLNEFVPGLIDHCRRVV